MKNTVLLISALSFAPLAELPLRGAEISASAPPSLNSHPGPEYGPAERKYQGIPTIERAPNGRLWAAWYAGPVQEDRYNYVVMVTSSDDGRTWSDLKLVIDPDGFGPVRASDPCLWLDPRGRLWLFWFQNPDKDATSGPQLFAITTDQPGEETPRWSAPRLLGEGIPINKPTVLANGDWLLPAAIWRREQSCRVLVSTDEGQTWALRGAASVPRPEDRQCDEPMIVERRDGSLWMLVRTNYGIGESVSRDQGRTWSPVAPTTLPHTPTRFYLRRLISGRLLLVKHGPLTGKPVGRKQLLAYLSDDDGRTWQGGLMIDERSSSYPDGTQAADGTIRVIYDHDRFDAKHILLATFREADVLAAAARADQPDPEHQGIQDYGDPATAEPVVRASARLRVLINAATGVNTRAWLKDARFLRPAANEDGQPLLGGTGATLEPVSGGDEIRPLATQTEYLSPPQNTPSGVCVAQTGQRLWRDRPTDINVVPKEFAGRSYLLTYSGHAAAVCRSGGIVYVFTPAVSRHPESAEELLRAQGFAKAAVREFLLHLGPGDRATAEHLWTVFQKKVSPGERIEFQGLGLIVL
jgi:predicted neuraminidase